jgi:hypothetical protein
MILSRAAFAFALLSCVTDTPRLTSTSTVLFFTASGKSLKKEISFSNIAKVFCLSKFTSKETAPDIRMGISGMTNASGNVSNPFWISFCKKKESTSTVKGICILYFLLN